MSMAALVDAIQHKGRSMPTVVAVHGIGQQTKGPGVLEDEWGPAFRDGIRQAGLPLDGVSLACAFYGGLFRPAGGARDGAVRAAGDPKYRASDLSEDEADLLLALWHEAARVEPMRVTSPDADVRASTPASVQAGLRLLARSRFFAGLAESALIADFKQVRLYLRDARIRAEARAAVDAAVAGDTRVLIGHSLGSVVAYEALHVYRDSPRWANVRTLITLGSPLGIPNLIFDALDPAPAAGRGLWPSGIDRWANVSDDGDVVALAKQLAPLFGGNLVDVRVVNGATAHDVRPYLTAKEPGASIPDGPR